MGMIDMSQTPAPFPQPQQQPVPAAASGEVTYADMLAIQASAPVAINYDDMARYYFPYPTRYTYTDKGCDEVQYGHDGKPYNPTGKPVYPYRCGGKTIHLGGIDIDPGIAAAAAAAAALLLLTIMRR